MIREAARFDASDPLSRASLLEAVAELASEPDRWLDTPHGQLGGRPPRTLLDSRHKNDRWVLYTLLQNIRHGMFT